MTTLAMLFKISIYFDKQIIGSNRERQTSSKYHFYQQQNDKKRSV